jgi:hypothetical protein
MKIITILSVTVAQVAVKTLKKGNHLLMPIKLLIRKMFMSTNKSGDDNKNKAPVRAFKALSVIILIDYNDLKYFL